MPKTGRPWPVFEHAPHSLRSLRCLRFRGSREDVPARSLRSLRGRQRLGAGCQRDLRSLAGCVFPALVRFAHENPERAGPFHSRPEAGRAGGSRRLARPTTPAGRTGRRLQQLGKATHLPSRFPRSLRSLGHPSHDLARGRRRTLPLVGPCRRHASQRAPGGWWNSARRGAGGTARAGGWWNSAHRVPERPARSVPSTRLRPARPAFLPWTNRTSGSASGTS